MSITERPVNAALKTMLVNNEPFQYAHLIKFERPSRPDSLSGLVSTSKQRYTYLTDASINVSFDDGSVDLQGVANGSQVYLANKVLSVGTIQEQTKATTSTTSLVLDGNGLGAEITGTAAITLVSTGIWDIVFAAPITLDDLLSEGFREGDKVTVNGTSVNINSFRSGNTLRVTKIDTDLSTAVSISVQLKLASEEIISVLLNKNATEYASFINREVYIYRAYFREGVMVGSPTCMFKGIISGVSFEDSETSIKVTWSLSSHWADFAQVKGRVTSDAAHRALDANGAPQVNSALKPIYAYDKGFIHSETSINALAKYVVMVEKIGDIKSKKGFLGIGASVKVKKYMAPEDRFTNLDFQLQAKSIPVIYGVRKTEGIPIFADTLNSNSAEVYLAAALCEGEIGGIYDVYIDGQSLICNDKGDYDARATQTPDQTVEVVCRGRSDRGDVLSGESFPVAGSLNFFGPNGEDYSLLSPDISNAIMLWQIQQANLGSLPTVAPASSNSYGLTDGSLLRLAEPINMELDIFTGKPGQKASSRLSTLAYNKSFKVQNSYWTGSDTYEYWGPNHRLLDTAYVVGKFTIKEGDTSIPEMNFVVRGKVIDCYNYDYSFLHDTKASSELESDFSLGDVVTLWRSDTNAQINTSDSIQIIDKWTFMNPDGTQNVRFRFSANPALIYDANGKPSIKKFYMKNQAGTKTWTMVAHNYNILGAEYSDTTNRVFVREPILAQVSSVTNSSGNLAFSYTSTPNMTINADTTNSSALFQLVKLNSGSYEALSGYQTFSAAIMSGTATATSLASNYSYSVYYTEATSVLGSGTIYLASKNTARLPATASAVNGYYTGYLAEITRYNSITGKSLVQVGEIVGYDGTTQIITINGIWDFIPINTDTIRIYPKYADSRVSINPAIQALDYITSKTYGKGLDPYKDLDLPSWMESGRKCDTKSDVTVLISSGTPVIGDVYRYTNAAGKIIWQGTVASFTGNYITFTNVIGKLTNKWNSWKTFNLQEIIYNVTGSLYKVDTAGIFTEPTSLSTPAGLSALASLSLTRASGTGSVTLGVNITSGNPVQNTRNGQKISGYSIYDCDDIDYWKVAGWDEHSQRYVTKNQCNIVVDTSSPLFDNMNGILEHFNGMLRYTAGKYYLDVEEAAGTINTTDVRTITVDDIIGKIQLSDEGTRSSFNSLTASFADPANKFEARNVSFFNSDYLKADRNVSKKGNLSIPGITNYYNTRLLADSFLNKSRFGLTISMTLRPSGFLLLAGTVIQVIYPRYDWTSPGKKFRIESVNYQPDGLVDIVAREYDDSFYTASNIRRVAGTGATTIATTSVPGNPTNLIVTSADTLDELLNGVELFWDNDPSVNESPNASTEIYGSLSPNLFITVKSINGTTNVLSVDDGSAIPPTHGLIPGMPIFPVDNYTPASTTELDSNSIYYVLTTPTTSTFTLTDTKNGTTPVDLSTGSSLSFKFRTATLLGAVPVPIRSFVDTVANEGSGRVEKYYWVRHRINRI
jgi:hypothetical protein